MVSLHSFLPAALLLAAPLAAQDARSAAVPQTPASSWRSPAEDWLISGYMSATFADSDGPASSFSAHFNPILVWRLDERLLAEAEFQFEAGETGEHDGGGASLEYAQISYSLCDSATVAAGQFLSPFGIFNERYHPDWINRLPNAPLGFGHEGLVPASLLGAQVRGGVNVGSALVRYAAFVANGPELNSGMDEPEEAGLLHWDPEADGTQDKAFGGRVSVLPVSWLELGVSAMSTGVLAEGASEENLNASLVAADVSAVLNLEDAGMVRMDAEWVSSQVDRTTYLFGTPDAVDFANDRSGGWLQFSYRAAAQNGWLSQVEPVARWDWVNLPAGAPESEDLSRLTLGLDWWMSSRSLLKFAVESLSVGDEDFTTFTAQVAVGL